MFSVGDSPGSPIRADARVTRVCGSLEPFEGVQFAFDHFVEGEFVESVDGGFEELTHPFLTEIGIADALFVFNEFEADAGDAFGDGSGVAEPVVGGAIAAEGGHFAVKKTVAAVGRADDHEVAVADGEHGAEGEIDVIVDAGGFVEQHERDGGEAAGCYFDGGQADEAGAVRKNDGVGVDAVGFEGLVKLAEEGLDLEKRLTGLASGGGDDEDETAGLSEEPMGDHDGGDGGLAPLAVAVEGDAPFEVRVPEDVFLGRFELEVEEMLSEEEEAHDGAGVELALGSGLRGWGWGLGS